MKTLAATAPTLLVWVIKHKLTTQLILLVTHLRTDQSHHRLTVDHHLYASLLHHLVKLFDLFLADIVHIIRQTGTPLLRQTNLYSNLYYYQLTSPLSSLCCMMVLSLVTAVEFWLEGWLLFSWKALWVLLRLSI